MHPVLQIRFPDTGHIYQVATDVVLNHQRAAGNDLPPEAYLVLGGMPWADLEPHASLVGFEPPEADLRKAAILSIPMRSTPQVSSNADDILRAPVLLLLQAAADASSPFSCYELQDNTGNPAVCITLTTGGPGLVKAATAGYTAFQQSIAAMAKPSNPAATN